MTRQKLEGCDHNLRSARHRQELEGQEESSPTASEGAQPWLHLAFGPRACRGGEDLPDISGH